LIGVDVSSRGDKELQRKIGKLLRSDPMKVATTRATMRLWERIKTKEIRQGAPGGTPVPHYLTERHGGSGLLGAIQARVSKGSGSYEGRVGAGGLKGAILKAHEIGMTIRPKRGPYLKFRTADGAFHTVKQVHLKPRQTFRRAERNTKAGLVGYLDAVLRDLIRKARLN
jgi:hypothetical protein